MSTNIYKVDMSFAKIGAMKNHISRWCFCPHLLHLLSDLGEIQCKRSEYSAAEQLCI